MSDKEFIESFFKGVFYVITSLLILYVGAEVFL